MMIETVLGTWLFAWKTELFTALMPKTLSWPPEDTVDAGNLVLQLTPVSL